MSERNHTPGKFVILAVPRSGSNMLCTMLNSHPDVLCHHELFNPDDIFYALPLRDSCFSLAADTRERDHAPDAFVQRVWQQSMEHEAVGFKMTYKQHLSVFNKILKDKNIHKIILRRENQVKTHVSRLVAEQTGIWEDYQNKPPEVRCMVEVDQRRLVDDIATDNAYYQEISDVLAATSQSATWVTYESLHHPESHQQLCDGIGVSYQPLIAQSRKQNPDDIKRVVSNYSQLRLWCDLAGINPELSCRYE